MTVYDYSFARPDLALLGEGVMRYLCPLPNVKALDADELGQLHQAMKPVGIVWERDTNDIDGGYDQGHRYGTEARRQARTLGFPDTVPIYWAVDKRLTNITRNTALDYGRGFTDAAGAARPYGEAALIDAAVDLGICDGGWCPETWGHSPHVVLSQVVGASDVPGTDANNVLRSDWGGWHPDIPNASPAPTLEDFLMALSPDDQTRVLKNTDDIAYSLGHDIGPAIAEMRGLVQNIAAAEALEAGKQTNDAKTIAKAIADQLGPDLAADTAHKVLTELGKLLPS